MTATIIDGKAAAAALRARVGTLAEAFTADSGRKPGLAVVLVGEDAASSVYVRNKGKATLAANMASFEHRLPADTSQAELIALVDALNRDDKVDGILVQLPLPDQLDAQAVLTRIDPEKDVDGFHPVNAGRLATGLNGFVPCTPLGCLMLLRDQLGELAGLNAVVVGRSNIVGKPMAALLTAADCTVTIAHSRTRNLAAHLAHADIVVAAVGRAKFVKGEWIKPGATVIDVGINRTEDGLVGDVDFEGAASVAAAITPVPGGVGPMTIACLLRNTLVAAHRRTGIVLDAQAI
ncbi:bifunctional methylenetetrahydrofolate dehydrogenase/methenyltetrahydrofolate cyclohydrolase FolD [Sphingomonas qomolangmaensis]|uniref:Bifunctional protein FolD n=1 Tax=Sphingomonas qomolangmaensis TaxID=2918765 RepID=A0ABY5L6I7_9SPHN|nr:bifunctional methylenetetrahydrofolate dehydrogenase/methenyltetrahydrofolate cyclohydrolase FolD [Sphingomonas qomolangmaensis]UUL81771.1 bifunctional methylenetetrahydrofolate dehydrogenase/methenyltetrahydrofolate cyclohydrolase FolD [Sphingomonas qomolangmaensis]